MKEPCPFCGCPGEQFDGHACEDYERGRVRVTEADELRKEVDRALVRLAVYEEVLRNIALGYENAGREETIGVREYAAQALGIVRGGCT